MVGVTRMSRWTVVLPVVNEVENLKVLLPQLLLPDVEIIVCDNGSTDRSQQVVISSGAKLSIGHGTVTDAILRGIELATSDKIVIMDADLSHPAKVVPEIAEKLDKYEIVVASRTASHDSFFNRFISWGFQKLAHDLAPKIHDTASGFWGIRTELARSVKIRNTKKPMLEFLVRSKTKNVGEVPYTFAPRASGRSKLGRSPSTLISEFWSLALLYMSKYRLLNYMVIGFIGYCINLGIYYPLTLVFKAHVTFLGQVFYLPPYVISALFASSLNYYLNKHWTFGDRNEESLGFLRYWLILGPTLLIDLTLIFLMVQFAHFQPLFAAAIGILLVFLGRYSMANKFIWNAKKKVEETT
jgi:dolichol-phosphate mannosyltransferase